MLRAPRSHDCDTLTLFQQNTQLEHRRKPVTVWLYVCEDCNPATAEEVDCAACLQKVKISQSVGCLVKDSKKSVKLHLICATQLRSIFSLVALDPYQFVTQGPDLETGKKGAVMYRSAIDVAQK